MLKEREEEVIAPCPGGVEVNLEMGLRGDHLHSGSCAEDQALPGARIT